MLKQDEKAFWILSHNFSIRGNLEFVYPKVGDIICGKTVLSVWVNKNNTLKAYNILCGRCGSTSEYVTPSSLKDGKSEKCKHCANLCDAHAWFYKAYGHDVGSKVIKLYGKRYQQKTTAVFPDGIPFEEKWKTSYKDFAEYVTSLPDFSKWPEYELNRKDNSKGYVKGNLEFVSKSTNMTNRTNVRKIEINGIEYLRPDFIRLLSGGKIDIKLRDFLFARIDIRKYSIEQTLKELYKFRNSFSLETKASIQNWFDQTQYLKEYTI